MANYQYPATIESNGEGGFIASFRDVPEANYRGLGFRRIKK